MYDLLIVGGGPSGVAAAAYARHLGLETCIISPDLGGKVNYKFSIEGLHNVETVHGASLVQTFRAMVGPMDHQPHEVCAIEVTPKGFRARGSDDMTWEGRALIVATGAKPRRLHVPGEEAYWQRGLSYSAISHAPLFGGKTVALIGNDRRAQVAALELSRVAERVLFIAPQPQLLDEVLMRQLGERGNTALFTGWEVTRVEGRHFVTSLALESNRGVMRDVAVDGVFIALGLIPNSVMAADLVARNDRGFIRVDERTATSRTGLFAAGDVTTVHAEQVPVALGEGIKAALSASEYLATIQ